MPRLNAGVMSMIKQSLEHDSFLDSTFTSHIIDFMRYNYWKTHFESPHPKEPVCDLGDDKQVTPFATVTGKS